MICDSQVVNHSTCPEWKEGFTWAFDVPPKGQKLYILCKSKNTFGKVCIFVILSPMGFLVHDFII